MLVLACKFRRFIVLFVITLLVFASFSQPDKVAAQSLTCTKQQRPGDYPATQDLAFIKQSKIPLPALLKIVQIQQDVVYDEDMTKALVAGGMTEAAASAFMANRANAEQLFNIVFLNPSREVTKKANDLLDTYGIAHNKLGMLAAVAADLTKYHTALINLGLSPSQADGFVKDSQPLVLEARRTGVLKFSLILALQNAVDDAGFNGDYADVGDALDDPAKLSQVLTKGGISADKLPPLLDQITDLKNDGLSVTLMDGWDIWIVIGILQAYGLPTLSLNPLVAQNGNTDATSACLKAFGLSDDEVTVMMAQLYDYVWDETNTPYFNESDIADYEDEEVTALMDAYGLSTDDDLDTVFDDVNNIPELTTYLKSKGLTDDQISNFVIDLQGSLFTVAVDPAQSSAFMQRVQQATPTP